MKEQLKSSRDRAITFMLLSAFSFSIMQTAVKLLGKEFPFVEKVFFRNFISLFIAAYFVHKKGGRYFGATIRSNMMLIYRSLLGLTGVVLIFFAIDYLSLGDSSIYMRLSPFWVILLAALFLGEKIRLVHFLSVLFAFLGVLVIAKPGFSGGSSGVLWASVAGVVASIAAASAYTLVSKLKKYEKPETIVFFFSLVSVVVTFPLTIIYGVMPTGGQWLLLLTVGGAAASGQLFLTHSYRLGKASEVSIYNYSGILYGIVLDFVLGFTVKGYGVKPFGVTTIVGGLLITCGGLVMYFYGKRDIKKG